MTQMPEELTEFSFAFVKPPPRWGIDERVPGYWFHETSGILKPAIVDYLNNAPISAERIRILKAYFYQWIDDGSWRMGADDKQKLLETLIKAQTRKDLAQWLDVLEDEFTIDPL